MIELWYETHSTTLDNERGVATGWLPGELSDAGRRQAEDLGKRLRERELDLLIVSDLKRAADTAAIATGESGPPVVFDARLRECNYGKLNGCPLKQLASERGRRIDTPFPGGESYVDVVNRTAAFLAELATERDGRRIGVIAHSANRWALEHLLNGRPLAVLVEEPFAWQPGWRYELPEGWRPGPVNRGV